MVSPSIAVLTHSWPHHGRPIPCGCLLQASHHCSGCTRLHKPRSCSMAPGRPRSPSRRRALVVHPRLPPTDPAAPCHGHDSAGPHTGPHLVAQHHRPRPWNVLALRRHASRRNGLCMPIQVHHHYIKPPSLSQRDWQASLPVEHATPLCTALQHCNLERIERQLLNATHTVGMCKGFH